MKVIGKTETGWILEASKNELSNLIGYYSSHSDGQPKIEIGKVIDISSMYDQLSYLSNNKKTIRLAASKLREYADKLELINPMKDE